MMGPRKMEYPLRKVRNDPALSTSVRRDSMHDCTKSLEQTQGHRPPAGPITRRVIFDCPIFRRPAHLFRIYHGQIGSARQYAMICPRLMLSTRGQSAVISAPKGMT